jgi:hypothetical protein
MLKSGKGEISLEGKPLYFAKTSGTTSGQNTFRLLESMPYHIEARNAILLHT